MKLLRITLLAGVVCVLYAADAAAQITFYRPSYSPVVVSPAPAPAVVPLFPTAPTYVAPAVRYSPVVPAPYPSVAYGAPYVVARPITPAVAVAPLPAIPIAPVPIAPAAYYGPVTVGRPVVIGPGIGGLPNTYVPGQPVRNALRFAIP